MGDAKKMNKIPKVIHYIWLGSEIPKKVQQIINNNKQFFQGYKVKIWTEDNMPPLNKFAQYAYNEKKWAFVSDYLRFYILYNEGGIYLDTDMEVLKSLDDLLQYPFFSGWDRTGQYVYAGIIGSMAKNNYVENILKKYDEVEEEYYPTSPQIMTDCYVEYQDKERLKIFESKYFYPLLDGEKETMELMKDAYTNHLWFESWRGFVPLRRLLRRAGLMKIYHLLLNNVKK